MLRLAQALVLLWAGMEAGAAPSGGIPPAKSVAMSRATSEIEIDGVLDERAWADAAELELIYEWLPGDGIAPPVQTEALLTYDDHNLYVAFRADDPRPEQIRAHLMDRDSIDTFVQDDHVSVMIDTFNDQRRAYQFRVNPLGVQVDGIFSEIDGGEDFAWDVIWDSAGRITDRGYVVELSIPLHQLSFPRAPAQTWGVEVGRSYPRDVRYRIAAHYRDRNNNCLLCQINKVTGIDNLEPGLNLELDPTLVLNRIDARTDFPDGELVTVEDEVELGLTARWGFTPNLTLNGAIHPDFSQVEADAAQLAVNERFALFFPEQRPFFLEGVDYFSTPIDAVFTRTVVDPDWGVKLTGKEGKNAMGVFAAQDRFNSLLFPSNQGSASAFRDEETLSAVLRYRRDVGESSTVGALYTGRQAMGYHNNVAGVDGLIRIDKINEFVFQYLRSDTQYPDPVASMYGQSTEPFSGDALFLDWNRVTRDWVVSVEYEDRDEGFRADSGFVPRVDYRRLLGVVRRNFWGQPDDWYARFQVGGFGFRTEDQSGQLTDETVDVFASLSGPLQTFAELSVERNKTFFGGVLYEDLDRYQLYFEIQPGRVAKLDMFADTGDTVDFANNQPADLQLLDLGVELKLGRHFNAQLDHTLQRLDVEGGRLSEVNLSQTRLVYQFNVRIFVRAILQYQDLQRDPTLFSFPVPEEDRTLFSQFLFSYKLNARTVAFAGYSDSQRGSDQIELTPLNRTYFVKLGYAWVR